MDNHRFILQVVPMEVRVDGVRDDQKHKFLIRDLIENRGGKERGGIGRFRVINMTRNRSLSVFISMRRLHENRWLLELLRSTPLEGVILTAWPEADVEVYLPINTLTDHTQAPVILPVLPPLLQPLNYQPENPVQAQPPVIQAPVIPPVLPQQLNQPVNPAPVNPAQCPQPIPVINVYPRVVLNIDPNALINRLGRSTIELNPRERQQEPPENHGEDGYDFADANV
ncbi:unnamed protein product [Brachionus calyciflorus]|uniref:Uncharacterized protein n=1 Tax=Brachionus calyciflorus TaxID=104777 RepID=A0A813YZJ6_9BILA|nr:unnamed protein product [Brachionus calyciflorus]